MNKRERTLLIVVGGALGVLLVYNGINYIFISPIREAKAKIARFESEANKSRGIIQSKESLVRRWSALVGRTFSHELPEASNRLAKDVKEIAKRHQVAIGSVSPASGLKIGSKTGIDSAAYRVVVEGKFSEALAMLLDFYRTPYLCQITKVALSPVMQKGRARDEVKLEFTIESPVLPVIDRKQVPEASNLATMPVDADPPLPPARATVKGPQDFPLLADRIIFRPYLPPPTNVIVVDNQDWKTVALRVVFLWDGRLSEEVVDTLPSKTQRQYSKKGDIVEVSGAYADGKSFGPEKFDFNTRKDFTYQVAVHSPPPPPVVVDLAVDNQDKDAVDVDLSLTLKDGAGKTKPTIRVKGQTKIDVDAYECASLQVAAVYASGKKASPATFKPGASKQVYVVPPEPAVEVVDSNPKPVNDPPPDAGSIVTGLITYQGVQEMIVASGPQRKYVTSGQEGAVDGGRLLAVHPLGGVVKMPSGNYYLYPLGRKFTERVKLDAYQDADLAASIDAWTRR